MKSNPTSMRCRRLALSALAAIAFAAVPATHVTAQDIGLPIGAKPVAARVEDLDGNTVDLSSHIGTKPVLVEFWATWCEQCRALEPRLDAAKKKFGDRVEFLIVAVAVNQTPRQIRRHLEGHPPPGPVFYDRRGEAVRAFAAPTTSYIAILDATGKVVYTGSGADQQIAEALAKVTGG